jgi:hypothetical protein
VRALNMHIWGLLLATLVFSPVTAAAQAVDSFEYLPSMLKTDETVVVTTGDGRQTKGRIFEVSATSLVLDVPGSIRGERERQVFASREVTTIRRKGPARIGGPGLLIGLALGVGATAITYADSCNSPDPECQAQMAALVGLPAIVGGAVAGALIDNANRSELIYTAPFPVSRTSASIAPQVGKKRAGVALSVRF